MSGKRRVEGPFLAVLVLLGLVVAVAFWHFLSEPKPRLPLTATQWHVSPLAGPPDWERIAPFLQRALISREEFLHGLEQVYGAGDGSWQETIEVLGDHALVKQSTADPAAAPLRIPFSTRPPRSVPRYWRPREEIRVSASAPLDGVRIAIDPGHIGGEWAKMEERWYKLPSQPTEVREGDMTLVTAGHLQTLLADAGAEVTLVRTAGEPVTDLRPEDFVELTGSQREARLFFYRKAEIRARAERVNKQIKPDLVVCLHFNAEPWGEPGRVTFSPANHLHLLVNGHYSRDELAYDDMRADMVLRLLERIHTEEIPLADSVSRALAEATGLPAYDYDRGHMARNAHRVLEDNGYVWARNLMANRLYQCPVVFCEPYVMNNQEVYERVAAGDYDGEREVAGKRRPSIYREYAVGVAEGLKRHFLERR